MNKRSSLLKDVLRLLRHLVRAYRAPFTPVALNGKNDAIKFRTCKRGFKINPKYGRTSVVGDTTSTQKNHCQLAACGADSLPEQTILCPGARFWQVLPCLLEMYFPWALAAPGRLSPKLHPGRDEHRERRRRAEREGEPMVRHRSGISSHRGGAQEVELGWDLTARKALRSKDMKDLGEGWGKCTRRTPNGRDVCASK